MNSGPVEYVVALFQTETGAAEMVKMIQERDLVSFLGLHEMALLQKDAAGNLSVREPGDAGGGKGAAVGGVVGALVGVLLGPAVVVATAAGALVGGLAAKLMDSGFDNHDLQALAEALAPGTSALLLVVDDANYARLVQILEAENAHVVADALNPQLVEGLNAAYASFVSKLKERGIDGLTAEDWNVVGDRVRASRRQASSQLGADFIDPLV